MLACIPTAGNAGLDDTVYNHFGAAPYFTLYDTETHKLTVVENRNAHHDHGTCHPMNQLNHYRLDCIVCSGMGRRAVEALSAEGITVYQCDSQQVRDAIGQLTGGRLAEIDPLKACRGHGQHIDTGYRHAPGRGAGFGQGQGRGRGQGGGRRKS
jgi:predicted Fe-Mo cluster-binding NifX family protein